MKWYRTGALAALAIAACAENPTQPGGTGPLSDQPLFGQIAGAGYTSVNEDEDGAGHCKNGNPNNNCNIYDGKEFVWLNGGPLSSDLGAGEYFFAVLEPSGQGGGDNPNDGTPHNLSDDFDDIANRTFTINSDGSISYGGTHDFDAPKIRLDPYATTSNPGGVYILAICAVPETFPVDASSCKYDAFKVLEGEVVLGSALTTDKTAVGAYTRTFTWDIAKEADKASVTQSGGNVTFTYTVTVSVTNSQNSGIGVSGSIKVYNPNVDGEANPVAVDITSVVDELSDGTVCTVTDGGAQTLTAAQTSFAYECALNAVPESDITNKVTVSWPDQFLDNGAFLAGGSAEFTSDPIVFTATLVDDEVDVTDVFDGGTGELLGTVSYEDAPKSFVYERVIPVQPGCVQYDNTATFTTNTTETTGSADETVEVCGPVPTGARTIGFWQNKNGQAIIGTYSGVNCQDLRTYLNGFNPFKDLTATTCTGVKSYVTNVIKAANSSGASMNAMLKAQMLATALDVYFSDPAKGGNRIGATGPIGSVVVDLTNICTPGSPLSCVNASTAFNNLTSATVSELLTIAASESNSGGSTWYNNVKATQELAKNTFDAINNGVTFSP